MIYVASPYTHHDKEVMTTRAAKVREFVAYLARRELIVYSPIVHWHPVAVMHNLPRDSHFWKKANDEMLSFAEEMYILAIDGWQSSIGILNEISFAKQLAKPITCWTRSGSAFVPLQQAV